MENLEDLSDKELEDRLTTALNWRDRLEGLQTENMRRVEAKKLYVEIVCPVCGGSGEKRQAYGGCWTDIKCDKCNGKGSIQGYLKD